LTTVAFFLVVYCCLLHLIVFLVAVTVAVVLAVTVAVAIAITVAVAVAVALALALAVAVALAVVAIAFRPGIVCDCGMYFLLLIWEQGKKLGIPVYGVSRCLPDAEHIR